MATIPALEPYLAMAKPVTDALRGLPAVFPEPLSPWFQQGGMFDFINEDLGLTVAFLALLFLLDNLLIRHVIHSKARYFALHVVANCISAYASFPDLKRAFVVDPLNSFSGPSCSMVANSAASAIHLYHVFAFPLRADDIFHHVSFVIALCGLAIPYKQVGGVANNLGCFFLCGLPGAFNYAFLVLYYHGWMSRKAEKKWTARVNVWVRGPAMSVYTFLGFQAWYRGSYQVPFVFLLLVVFLHFTNGQYYAAQAVESLTKHSLKEAGKLKGDGEEEGGEGASKDHKAKKTKHQ